MKWDINLIIFFALSSKSFSPRPAFWPKSSISQGGGVPCRGNISSLRGVGGLNFVANPVFPPDIFPPCRLFDGVVFISKL